MDWKSTLKIKKRERNERSFKVQLGWIPVLNNRLDYKVQNWDQCSSLKLTSLSEIKVWMVWIDLTYNSYSVTVNVGFYLVIKGQHKNMKFRWCLKDLNETFPIFFLNQSSKIFPFPDLLFVVFFISCISSKFLDPDLLSPIKLICISLWGVLSIHWERETRLCWCSMSLHLDNISRTNMDCEEACTLRMWDKLIITN